MNKDTTVASPGMAHAAPRDPDTEQQRRAWRATIAITGIALGVYFGVRWLPIAHGSLHYTDFNAGSKSFLEFCEPGCPQFAPVDKVKSPVEMVLHPRSVVLEGVPAKFTVTLTTSSGKPVTADDLLVAHTQKLHLLIVDPTLDDYQHVHPRLTSVPGEYAFEFTPRRSGRYRLFADFVPRATGRGLYAGADLLVPGGYGSKPDPAPGRRAYGVNRVTVDGFQFELDSSRHTLHTNESAGLALAVTTPDGAPAKLELIMGAHAHVVVFDSGLSGFAHLHPTADSTGTNDAGRMTFQLTLSDPGDYRLWAQVKVGGREIFAPFDLRVEP